MSKSNKSESAEHKPDAAAAAVFVKGKKCADVDGDDADNGVKHINCKVAKMPFSNLFSASDVKSMKATIAELRADLNICTNSLAVAMHEENKFRSLFHARCLRSDSLRPIPERTDEYTAIVTAARHNKLLQNAHFQVNLEGFRTDSTDDEEVADVDPEDPNNNGKPPAGKVPTMPSDFQKMKATMDGLREDLNICKTSLAVVMEEEWTLRGEYFINYEHLHKYDLETEDENMRSDEYIAIVAAARQNKLLEHDTFELDLEHGEDESNVDDSSDNDDPN